MAQSQLEKFKKLLEIPPEDTSKDSFLQLLLDDVESDLLSWTNRDKLSPALESIQRRIAVIRYNMQGVEGQTVHSEGGISRSFDDLPESIRSVIKQNRLLKAVRYATKKT